MERVKPWIKLSRILWLVSICSSLFAVLFGRLFVLMILPSFPDTARRGVPEWTTLRSHADMEHFRLRLVDNARGEVLYKSGLPMQSVHTTANRSDSVAGIIGQPDLWPVPHQDVAVHGRTGLEYRFDSMLQGARGGYVGTIAKSNNGRQFYFPARAGSDIRTTIDYAWQNASNAAIERARVKEGAIVVLDIHTNEILALTSIGSNRLADEAVRPYSPGSVFKLVVAATALETHTIHETSQFECTGRLNLPQVHMACWKVHGIESFTQALVESCDIALAEIAIRVGKNPIETLAGKLGLTSTGLQTIDGKSVLPEAFPGQVFRQKQHDFGLLANTAIGQEDVRLSPVQGATLASAIAHGGLYKPAVLVVDAERHGSLIRTFANHEGWHTAFSGSTAAFLASVMEKVVTERGGTAHDLYPCDIAVKTGTAELADKRYKNVWVVGYMPVRHPQIAFAVLSAKVSTDKGHVQTHQIVRDLVRTYKQIYPSSHIR